MKGIQVYIEMKRRLKSEAVRIKRYALFLFQYIFLEKTRGLDFSMRIMTTRKEKNPLYHGYSKTNEKHLKMILSELNFEKCKNFLDIGCGKGVVVLCQEKVQIKRELFFVTSVIIQPVIL